MNFEPLPAYRFLTDPAFPLGSMRFRAAYGGRASGKSWGFVDAALFHATTTKNARIVFAREVQANLEESSFELVRQRIEHYGLGDYFRQANGAFHGGHGQKILFIGLWKGNKPEGIKSLEGATITVLEEATEVTQRSLDVLLPTVLRTQLSELWAIWNPNHATTPIDKFFRGAVKPFKAVVRRTSWRDNLHFGSALQELRDLDFKADPAKARWIWDGEYRSNSDAQVFRNWTVEPFETPDDAVLRFGADWGFSNDPTVLVRCFIQGRRLYIDQCVSEVGVEIDRTPALFDQIPGSRRWPIKADSARPETISYMRRAGFKITPAIKGPGSIEDGVEFLRSFDIVVHPRCPDVVRQEFEQYSYKVDRQTGETLPLLEDKWNNVIDSCRYALEAARKAQANPVIDKRYVPKDYAKHHEPEDDGAWKTI